MKELSIEQKAKRYDEAIERAKSELNSPDKRLIEYIFPELKESEYERIRKGLIEACKQSLIVGGFHKDKVIALLEKQGEKDKPTYTTCSEDVQLTQEEYDKRRASDEATIKEVEAYKKGLEDAQKIFEKQGEQKPENYDHEMWKNCQANFEGGKNEVINNPEKYGLLKPVENGQYQKGFEDALESVKKNWHDYFKPQDVVDIYNEGIKQGIASVEQKPVEWSEEDDKHLQIAINYTFSAGYLSTVDWLKSLKDRVQPQPEHEWSEEDEQIYRNILNHYSLIEEPTDSNGITKEQYINFIRTFHPQNKWRPSDEQMVAVQEAMNIVGILTITGSKINSLYQDLKKLREE